MQKLSPASVVIVYQPIPRLKLLGSIQELDRPWNSECKYLYSCMLRGDLDKDAESASIQSFQRLSYVLNGRQWHADRNYFE